MRLLPLLVLLAVGCSNGSTTKTFTSTSDEHTHGDGPHGGTMFDFGKGHGEFVVDHDKKTAEVYLFDGSMKDPMPIEAKILTLAIDNPSFIVAMGADPLEDGKASHFTATNDNFGVVQEFSGTVMNDPTRGYFVEKP